MNILVTGASRGIGYQTAKLLAQNGHSVIGTARSENALDALKKESPARIFVSPADLTADESVSELCEFVTKTFTKLD
ncbi:MAG: SDR family NAD(P)-dependent oxidoreductase, partial [Balneolaceae bacterium]|nr:SDR family NAD(P)-dependent oxidoreductase [Balneolaceae bacterium]